MSLLSGYKLIDFSVLKRMSICYNELNRTKNPIDTYSWNYFSKLQSPNDTLENAVAIS